MPRGIALRVLGAVDEPEQVAFVERAEPVYLLDDVRAPGQPIHQPLGEFEAQVEAVRTDVKQEVAGRLGRRVPWAGNLHERVQVGGTRLAEQTVPQSGADTSHAAQRALGEAEADRPPQRTDVRQQAACVVLRTQVHGQDEKDRRLGERRQDGL